MSSFFRLTLIGLCTTAGIAVAVGVATSLAPAEDQTTAESVVAAENVLPGKSVSQFQTSASHPPLTQQAAPSTPPLFDSATLRSAIDAIQQVKVQLQQGDQGGNKENSNPAAGDRGNPQPAAGPASDPGLTKIPLTKITDEGDEGLTMTIQGEDIRKVLELLSEQGGLNILASKSVEGQVSASLNKVSIETALDAILKSTGYVWRREGRFIYVGTPGDFDNMRQLLDRVATRLYRPNYVKAADLQALITPLLTEGVGSISVNTPAETGIGPDGNAVGGDGFAGQEALLVRDYEAVLHQIDQIVDQVDLRPTQVQIEAMILSVKLDDKNDLGVNFELFRDKANVRLISGSPPSSLANINVDNGGLNVGFLDSSLSVFINALETVGDTNVIATPRLLCLNKHRAQILIGGQLGYVSTTQTETSTTQSVEFLEIGTQLRLRPFISSDGMIRMEIHPELSTGTVNIEGGFTLPDKEVTEVTTNVMIKDGSTVIIGGLMRDELTSSASQIPFLGSLPVVGPLFRQNSEKTERREILVLITPHIVYEPEASCEGDQAASGFHHRQAVYADQMIPFGKRYIGRKYFRLAQDAWARGEKQHALRLINLAIHFDPLSRGAIDLRVDIVTDNPIGDHTAIGPEALGHPASPLEGEVIAPWLMERLEGVPAGPSLAPHHPLDPGYPGSRKNIDRPESY